VEEILLSERERSLPREQHGEFFKAVVNGATDGDLAVQFRLRERTATNYRLRAEEMARRLGIPITARNKGGAAASDDRA
jgi:hypothetical protein